MTFWKRINNFVKISQKLKKVIHKNFTAQEIDDLLEFAGDEEHCLVEIFDEILEEKR